MCGPSKLEDMMGKEINAGIGELTRCGTRGWHRKALLRLSCLLHLAPPSGWLGLISRSSVFPGSICERPSFLHVRLGRPLGVTHLSSPSHLPTVGLSLFAQVVEECKSQMPQCRKCSLVLEGAVAQKEAHIWGEEFADLAKSTSSPGQVVLAPTKANRDVWALGRVNSFGPARGAPPACGGIPSHG